MIQCKVLSAQVWGPKFRLPELTSMTDAVACAYNPGTRRWRREDPGGLSGSTIEPEWKALGLIRDPALSR